MSKSKKPRWTDSKANWLVQDTTGEWHFLYAKPEKTMQSYKYTQKDGLVSKEVLTIHFDLSTLEGRPW